MTNREDRATEYFRSFFEASQTILSSLSLKEVLKLLVKRAVGALGVKAGGLRLVNEETQRLELVASHLLSSRYLEKGALSTDESIPEVLKGKIVVIKDAHRDPRVQYREEKRAEGINTILSVPVVARERVIGVLRLYTAEPRDFAEEELEFASALAEMGGLAILNAKIYEAAGVKLASLLEGVGVEAPAAEATEAKRRFKPFAATEVDPARSLQHFRALHQVTRVISSTLDSREVTNLIIAKVLELMRVKGSSIRLVNETTRELELVAARGLSKAYLAKGPVHVDKSIRDALGGVPVLIADARTDPRVEYRDEVEREGVASILSLPIIARERVIGVLRLYSGERREYTAEEVAFVSALGEIAGIAITNAKLYERVQQDLSFWTATLKYLDLGDSQPE